MAIKTEREMLITVLTMMQVMKLVENYRSHPALIHLPSQLFYNGELVISAAKSLVECLCPWDQLPNRTGFPILFHGVRVFYHSVVLAAQNC